MSSEQFVSNTMAYWPPGWSYLNTYGPLVVGLTFSCLLLGVVWVMTYMYFYGYREDSLKLKIFIGVVCLLTTLDTASLCWTVVELMQKPGDFLFVLAVQVGSSGKVRTVCSSVCAFLVQGYMIHIFFTFLFKLRYEDSSMIKRGMIWTARIVLGGATLLGLGASWAAVFYAEDAIGPKAFASADMGKTQTLTMIWGLQYGTLLSVDVALTIIFSIYLHNLRTGFVATNRVINALVVILLRNGLLATSLQLAALLLYRYSSTYWITFPGAVSSKVYVLTLLSLITKPRSAREDAIEEGFRPPPGVSLPRSITQNSSTIPSLQYTCSSCRTRRVDGSTGLDVVIRRRGTEPDTMASMSFAEFLQSGSDDPLDSPIIEEKTLEEIHGDGERIKDQT